MEAQEPEEDDVITIYSPLHKTSNVSFRLNNRYNVNSSFEAFFSADSDPEFGIIPKSGELPRIGIEGVNFIISFTPTEYGKQRSAKLLIQTEDFYWFNFF